MKNSRLQKALNWWAYENGRSIYWNF